MATYQIAYPGPPLPHGYPDGASNQDPYNLTYVNGDVAVDSENVHWTFNGTVWSTTSKENDADTGTVGELP